jgi:hypothetical protein
MGETKPAVPAAPNRETQIAELRKRIDGLEIEKCAAEQALQQLQNQPGTDLDFTAHGQKGTTDLRPHDKVSLFLELFGARRSVYPKLWENAKTGKKGYSPACDNEWKAGICRKPQIKCTECRHQQFPALDERAVEAHLRGTHTIGTYALREDDSCIFVAADFDGEGWRDDVVAYQSAAKKCGIEVAIERSRSGNGAHAWIFFSEPVPAVLARRLATIILAKASAVHPTLSLGAYDRLFPNQDTMPEGGFGNLIALPLAKEPRKKGNTLFLDQNLDPCADQWACLATVRRLSRPELDQILARITHRVDLAMLPSLARADDYAELFQGYGLVLIDECHHVPAVSFEALLKACPARKIIGLTATPVRKDGLEKLLHFQCGPIRHTITVAPDEAVARIVHVRRSSFHLPPDQGVRPAIHLIWQALVDDVGRTNQVVADIRLCLEQGRCPLVLSDRKEHLAKIETGLAAAIGSTEASIFRLEGGTGKKQRQKVREEIDRCYATGGKFVLLATAALVGEGYDLPRLDTLILTMPLSFKGRLVQYAGRLHRPHADKVEVHIYDYLDDHPIALAMFRRRQSAYKQLGYRMELDSASDARFDFG